MSALYLIKGYLNIYNLNLERKMRITKLLQRLRRLSSHKTYVSNGEFRDTNDAAKSILPRDPSTVPYPPKLDDHVLVSTHAHLFDHLLGLTKIPANPNRSYELSSVLTTQNTPVLAVRWSMSFPAYTIGDTIEIEQSNPVVRLLGVMKRVMLKNQVDMVYDVEVEVGEKMLRYGGHGPVWPGR
jgi:hypothetical protein